MKRLLFILLVFILAALLAVGVLYVTGNLSRLTSLVAPPQEKTLVNNTDCGYNWATQQQPELTADLQKKLIKLGIRATEVSAAAYGENCLLSDGTVDHFIIRETDLYFKSPVADFTDKDLLGGITEEIILFVKDIPADTLPGPLEGYIQINFISDAGEMQSLWFQPSDGLKYLDKGLHGADLYNKLYKK